MELSDYIKSSLGTFSPNPDEWTLEQRLGLEWGKQAFELESLNAELVEALETVKIVNAGNGPLRYEIVDATCESALAKARGESCKP